MLEIGSKILVITGTANKIDDEKNLEIIDIKDSNYHCTKVASFPVRLDSATGGLINGTPLLCGGNDGTNNNNPTSDCFELDNSGTGWSKKGGLLEPRKDAGQNSVVINGKLIISGGVGSAGRLTSIEMVSPDASAVKLSVNLPKGLYGHCQVQWDNTTVMIIGGFDGSFSAATYFVDVSSEMIDTNGPTLNTGRVYHSCGELLIPTDTGTDAYIVVTGGNSLKSTEILKKTNNNDQEWKTGKNM